MEKRPSLSVVSAILNPRPSLPIRFPTGKRIFKGDDSVGQGLETHKAAAVLNRDALQVGLHHTGILPTLRVCHDHQHLGQGPVGPPQLPFRMYSVPSSESLTLVVRRAGSEPTSGSVT